MKKYTLQFRITVAVGLILAVACLLLTMNSLLSANNYYGDYAKVMESGVAEYDPELTDEMKQNLIDESVYYQEATEKFSVRSVVMMAGIVFLGLAVTYWAAGQMLKPLKKLTHSLQEVDEKNLDKRIPLTGVQGEVLVLSEAFNHMLERLEEAFLIQKSFASNAAHELKTPLAVIKSSLQVLEMNPQPETEDYREFMDDTEQSLERIIKTVDGLLSLANISAVPVDQEVELNPLLRQAVQELSLKASACQVEISVEAEQTVMVHGNPELLYRAFFNLIENAVKYNRPGGFIAVQAGENDGQAYVTVKDNGIGIEPDALGHIFEPFYRADPSRSQQIPGYGLGLAVVKMILERHGAEIDVASEALKGTVFTVQWVAGGACAPK